MPKVHVRDGVAAVVYNQHTDTHDAVFPGRAYDADDPFVAEHRELFDEVEQATAAPGEKRNTRRAS